jgi:uncharacterized membrane protein
MNFERIHIVYYAIILLLLSSIRFYNIDVAGIWLDEAHSIFQAHKNIGVIINDSAKDQNPPLYFILLHYWIKLFGSSVTAVRGLSCIFNILTVPLIFLLARKNINIITALFASLVFIFSDIQLYYAQEARVFSLVGLLCISSFIIFENLRKNTNINWKAIILLAIINSLMLYAHYISVFIIIAQILVALVFIKVNPNHFKQLIISGVVALVLFSPWLGKVLLNIPEAGNFWLTKPNFGNIKGIFISFSGNKLITVIYMVIIATGFYFSFNKHAHSEEKENKKYAFTILMSWTFLPIVITYIIAYFTPVFLIRYLLYSSIGLFLLIGFIISSYPIKEFYKLIIIAGIVLLNATTIKFGQTKGENWLAAVNKVKEKKNSECSILLSAYYTNTAFSYYYYGDENVQYNNPTGQLKNDNIYCIDKLDNNLCTELNLKKQVIAVQSHQIDADPVNTVISTLSKSYTLTESFDFENIKVSVFKKINQQ